MSKIKIGGLLQAIERRTWIIRHIKISSELYLKNSWWINLSFFKWLFVLLFEIMKDCTYHYSAIFMVAKKRNMTQSTIDAFFLPNHVFFYFSFDGLQWPKRTWNTQTLDTFQSGPWHLVSFSQTQVSPTSVFLGGKFSPHGN